MTQKTEATQTSYFHRWCVTPVMNQLRQGTSPEKLAWSISLGTTLGIFPIFGTPTIICLIVGQILRLNQPLVQLFKTFTYPLHLALILVFIHIGQAMNGVPKLKVSVPQLLVRFKDDPGQFAKDFGVAALHGVEAWSLVALVLIPLIYIFTLPLLRKLLKRTRLAAP